MNTFIFFPEKASTQAAQNLLASNPTGGIYFEDTLIFFS